MIGLDTNVLVRYIVEDDKKQARLAATLIEGAAEQGERLFVAQVVLCELVWVLRAAYGRTRTEIFQVLEAVLRTAQFDIEARELAHRALVSYDDGRADFADYLLAEQALEAGCDKIATFDRKLLEDGRFVAP